MRRTGNPRGLAWIDGEQAAPAQKESHMTRQAVSLDLADARRIIAAGERKAIEMGIPYNIAVADAGGGLEYFRSSDLFLTGSLS
jgi:Haem-degrading